MIKNIEDFLEEAQRIELHISPDLFPHIKRAIKDSSEQRKKAIELGLEKCENYRKYYELFKEQSRLRSLRRLNTHYANRVPINPLIISQEIDEISLSGLANCYLFNRFVRINLNITVSYSISK